MTLFFLFTSFQAHSLLMIEPYVSLGLGSADLDQTLSATNTLDHNESILQASAGGRAGLRIMGVSAGGVAEISKQHWDGHRADQTGDFFFQSKGYNNSVQETLYGGYVGFLSSSLRVWGEYYTHAEARFTYSGTEGENAFTEGAKLEGSGFGVGVGAQLTSILSLSALFRYLSYDQLSQNFVESTLPSSTLTKVEVKSLMIQFSFLFGI
jgi:hypothetical protein